MNRLLLYTFGVISGIAAAWLYFRRLNQQVEALRTEKAAIEKELYNFRQMDEFMGQQAKEMRKERVIRNAIDDALNSNLNNDDTEVI